MENVLQEFRTMQAEAEQRFQEWEDERWKREREKWKTGGGGKTGNMNR